MSVVSEAVTANEVLKNYLEMVELLKYWDNMGSTTDWTWPFGPTVNTIGCFDGRVPYPKIGLYGAGIWMTQDQARIAWGKIHKRCSSITNFLRHEKCASEAALLENFLSRGFKEEVAREAVERSSKKLFNQSTDNCKKALWAGYTKGKVPMSGDPDFHSEQMIIVTMQDFNPAELGFPPALYLSAWCHPDDEYSRMEMKSALSVILGPNGLGRDCFLNGQQKLIILFVGRHLDGQSDLDHLDEVFGSILADEEFHSLVDVYYKSAPHVNCIN